MKKIIKKTYIALLAVLVVMMTSLTAFAGGVTYEGGADSFVFSPGGSESPTNLFENFDELMPGDELTEKIDVKNNSGESVKIYMRALWGDESVDNFLSQLQLSVDSADTNIFDAPASVTASLTEWTLLGTLASGGSTTLDVKLSVPKNMGNEYQNAKGTVNWQFMAEVPDDEEDDDPDEEGGGGGSKTGDYTKIGIWIGLVVIAAVIIAVFISRRRRED